MTGQIHITNKTMELRDCENAWSFNDEYKCWCLEDILYTAKAVTPETQRLSIFVPEAYMNANGKIDEKGSINGYTAATVPVIFENNSAGYMPMPPVKLGEERCMAKQYLERGFVYITAGNRGSESKDEKEEYCGKSPMNLVDLEHADLAYEWMFSADKTFSGGTTEMCPFQKALSDKLKARYLTYFNSLKLVHPETKEILELGEDGRSGSGYEYLMQKINESATIFLNKLKAQKLEKNYSVEEYLNGISESTDAKAKRNWLEWDGERVQISDLDSYVLNHRRRLKSCPSFDTLENLSCENKVFGSKEEPCMHFNEAIAEIIGELKEDFPVEYEKYYAAYKKAEGDKELEKRVYLYNPLNYIGTLEKSEKAKFYRIRVGASDADTSFTVSMALALKLLEEGHPVDYQLVWDEPHCEADYPGEVCDWIEEICG